ncbi:RpoE-regulated lipoprotein [Rahnella bonaserana]|uniref:RpoE-regulated lipoprotein n=1 Tax=Rahnella bonaserana TaxID=2816248 RepID=UPI0024C25673|nr:RpoE-regulated lipoprotein [Rahnella bonaserana]WHZ41755.1 RpoE-regulated lipoprotein [Rahnella bonaserana]
MTVRLRVRPLLLVLPLILSGCSSMSNMSWPSVSWSGMNPLNWFGSSLTVSDKGVGGITSSTALTETAIKDALDGDYTLRSGMSMSGGKMLSFFQAMDGKDVKMSISGEPKGNVQRVDVLDPKVESEWGVKIGTSFSSLYSKAFDVCVKGEGDDAQNIECKAPQSAHVTYVFSGIWHGPESLMPSDDALKDWKVSKIIWRANPVQASTAQ